MKILFKLTTRSRPEKALACIKNIKEMCTGTDYSIIISADIDDQTMKGFEKLCRKADLEDKWLLIYNNSVNKIHAVNRDINDFNEDWDIIVSTSDDMMFTVKGFDDIIRQDFNGNLDQLLHYNDGNQKANVCTLSIMGREYYNRFGYVYHPDYASLWADVEATEVANLLGKYQYMGDDKVIFNHLHPAWGLCEWDEQYKKTEAPELNEKDRQVFMNRRNNQYGLNPLLIVNDFKYKNL